MRISDWSSDVCSSDLVVDGRRDLYDHSFALHAMAWAEHAVCTGRYGAWLDETLAVIDEAMAAPHGGWAESDGRGTPRRHTRQKHRTAPRLEHPTGRASGLGGLCLSVSISTDGES